MKLLVLLPLLLAVGCAAVKKASIDLAACAVGQVPAGVDSIIPDVEATLRGDSPDWKAHLEAMGATLGIDSIVCAVKQLMGDHVLASRPGGDLLQQHGKEFLAAHGIK